VKRTENTRGSEKNIWEQEVKKDKYAVFPLSHQFLCIFMYRKQHETLDVLLHVRCIYAMLERDAAATLRCVESLQADKRLNGVNDIIIIIIIIICR
jgi:hypothetical protein